MSANTGSTTEPPYVDEFRDVDWREIDCATYDRAIEHFGCREDFRFDAPDDQRRKLSVHISFTDSEGNSRSKTVWGNDRYGLILWWSGYLGGRKQECRHYIAAHVLEGEAIDVE